MQATADPASKLTRFTVPGPARAPWLWLAVALSLPSLIPLLSAVFALARPDPATIDHLLTHVLPRVARDTGWLLLGVGVASLLLGTALAALVALCDFPGRRWFAWLLVLPLVFPGYVLATVFIELFDYSGPVGTLLRELGAPELAFRSRAGLIAVLTLALYPYVYLVAREGFESQGGRALEVARSLGMGPVRAFLSTSLPLARPWVAGGALLVLMETLADFGTVAAFNYDTFTTAIYKAWFALFSPDTALQIAAVMLVFVIALVAVEAALRRQQSFTTVGHTASTRIRLGGHAWLATAVCGLVVGIAFVLPAGRLLWNAARHRGDLDLRYIESAGNAVSLATAAAALTAAVAFVVAMAARTRPGLASAAVTRLATIGYGLPGALLAIGLYVPVAHFSTWLANATGFDAMWQGGLALLLIGYGIRFLAVAHAPVAGGLLRIRPGIVDASRSLGLSGARQLRHVHWPLLRGSFAAAGLLVFVDVMKEMPITLMMRPFGWDTLATRVFELTSEGQWTRAALPSLAIVLAGLIPVILLTRRRHHAA